MFAFILRALATLAGGLGLLVVTFFVTVLVTEGIVYIAGWILTRMLA